VSNNLPGTIIVSFLPSLYSGDGKKTLPASWDKTIKEWDVESGQCLRTYQGNINVWENSGGSGRELYNNGNKIEIISGKISAPNRTFINIPGLFIQGCSFKNLHPDSDLSEKSKNLVRQYGAVVDE
jgi:WD40 repeat protein